MGDNEKVVVVVRGLVSVKVVVVVVMRGLAAGVGKSSRCGGSERGNLTE